MIKMMLIMLTRWGKHSTDINAFNVEAQTRSAHKHIKLNVIIKRQKKRKKPINVSHIYKYKKKNNYCLSHLISSPTDYYDKDADASKY